MSEHEPQTIAEIGAALHLELARKLLQKVRDGEATASDLNVARQFLKDNGIDAARSANPGLKKLADVLPFDADEEDLTAHG
ncbi:MAG: hypothetical protein H6590_06060 [Flavobacteriales bacterium]|nr:hypothetical protein [Flavobacteriales bacterium]